MHFTNLRQLTFTYYLECLRIECNDISPIRPDIDQAFRRLAKSHIIGIVSS